MIYCDIHTHRNSPELNRTNIVLFNRIILPDTDITQTMHNQLYSVGIHPWYIQDIDKQWKLLKLSLQDKQVVAIGEAGLDKLSATAMDIQQEVFRKQAVLAEQSGKPLIIHCVKAWDQLLAIRKEVNPRQDWIIHGFRGNGILASQLLKIGIKLSFGIHFHPEAVKEAWPEALFAETDEQSETIQTIYKKISTVLSVATEELAVQIRKNVAASFSV